MRRNYLSYIMVLLALLAVSCKDDATIERASEFSEGDGRLLSLVVDIPETRTRAVDLTPGAALYLKNIWVGVYDKSDGKRVGGATKDLGRMLTASDNTLIDLVSIELNQITATNNDRYCVVGVANYDGIKVIDPAGGTAADLKSMLDNADNWSNFKEIAIDTRNSVFENQVPLLIGYLGKETVTPQKGGPYYTMVNQFGTGNGVNLHGYINDDEVFVSPKLTGGRLSGINTKYTEGGVQRNYILKLRRMRSKINVIINEEPVPGITVTNLQYKMCNVPGSAFLAQRRTNTFSAGMSSDRTYSANSADVMYSDAGGYFDTEYKTPDINTNFSFEHFENKHWAKNTVGLTNYHDREKHDESGVFSALADNSGDWNNMASYFVLKMNVRDDNIGRNAEIEYTIHEGFCNDENGIALTDDKGVGNDGRRLFDFSCVRNTDYYYKIKINSINDIELQVTDSNYHTNDQKGNVWDIEYFTNRIVSSEEKEIKAHVSLKEAGEDEFVNSEDIAFRFVGSYFDTKKMKEIPVDVCYNFSRGDLDGFAGIWNVPTNESTEYIVAQTSQGGDPISAFESLEAFYSGGSDNALYFQRIINDIQIQYEGTYHNIKDYLEIVTQDDTKDPNIDGFKFAGLKYYEVFDGNNDDLRNHIRGLYIFDTQKAFLNGKRVRKDDDGCTYLYKIKGIEQVPVYLTTEEYEMISVSGDQKIPANESATFTEFSDGHTGNGMLLSEYPDFAFRLLGYDGNTDDYYDILYNFTQSEYTDLTERGEWPRMNLNGIYSSSLAKGALGATTIPASFLEGLKIIVKDSEYNIYDFVTQYENGDIRLSKDVKLGFKVSQYEKSVNTNDPEKYLRALYLFDKKNKFIEPALLSQDGNSAIFQVYAVEQLPTSYPRVSLTLPKQGEITAINSVNNYNFIDETIDEQLRIPEIPGVAFSDYKYKVIVRSNNNNKIVEGECFVDVEPKDGYFNFNIPIRSIPGSGGDIYLQAVSTSDRYISTGVSTFSVGRITLKNPVWNFAGTDWATEFKKWDNQGGYYMFNSGSRTLNKLKIRSKGKEVRGYVNSHLYFNSSNSDLFITTYKNCKVKVVVNGGNGDRILYVNPGGYSYDVLKNATNVTISTNIDIGSNYSDDIIIKFSGSASFKSVSLEEAD